MKTETLHNKFNRYVSGKSTPEEARQIQTWLSCTDHNKELSPEEKSLLEMEILHEIQAHTAYPLFYPKKKTWWQKFSALFL